LVEESIAHDHIDLAVEKFRQVGDRRLLALSYLAKGTVLLREGKHDEATGILESAERLIQDDGDYGISGDDQWLWLNGLFHGGFCCFRHGRSCIGVRTGRIGRLVGWFLTSSYDGPNEDSGQRECSKTTIHSILRRAGNSYLLKIRSSDMKSICGAQS